MATPQETLQRAKETNAFVRIVTRRETITARVLDVDRSNISLLVGERDRRQVHAGDVASVEIL